MTHTAEVATTEHAEFLATFPALLANGVQVDHEGSTVTLSDDALEILGELDEETDGHYSAGHIWIGGVGYRVERT